jgi:hypothetical protein
MPLRNNKCVWLQFWMVRVLEVKGSMLHLNRGCWGCWGMVWRGVVWSSMVWWCISDCFCCCCWIPCNQTLHRNRCCEITWLWLSTVTCVLNQAKVAVSHPCRYLQASQRNQADNINISTYLSIYLCIYLSISIYLYIYKRWYDICI